MKRSINYIAVVFILIVFFCTGCSNVADEKKILSDLENDVHFAFLDDGEKIEKLEIDKRQTEKKQNVDTVWCTITTSDTEVLLEKNAVLQYEYYDKGGWMLNDVTVNPSNEWIRTPLKGVDDAKVLSSLYGIHITVDGEEWLIEQNNITNFSIEQHNTNLENKTDEFIASLTLDSDAEEVKGQLVINYIFTNAWQIESLSENEIFTVTIKPEAVFAVTEDNIMGEIDNQQFEYGAVKSSVGQSLTLVDNSSNQMVTVKKSQLSDFRIDKQETGFRGSYQKLFCSGVLTTAHVSFVLNAEIEYEYSKNDGWNVKSVTLIPELLSVNIQGDWKGDYTAAGSRGSVTLSITDISDDGTISGVYSWTPNDESLYDMPGSYFVSGTMDVERLFLELKAGEWIVKPPKALSVTKIDIRTMLYIDDSAMKGIGHESASISIKN